MIDYVSKVIPVAPSDGEIYNEMDRVKIIDKIALCLKPPHNVVAEEGRNTAASSR